MITDAAALRAALLQMLEADTARVMAATEALTQSVSFFSLSHHSPSPTLTTR